MSTIGEHAVALEASIGGLLAVPIAAGPSAVLVAGTLLTAGRHDPISGVMLSARMQMPETADTGETQAIDVAAGTTEEDGSFALLRSDSIPEWVRCLLDNDCGGGGLTVYAHIADATVEVATVHGDSAAVTLEVALGQVSVDWSEVASNAQQHSLTSVNQLARALNGEAIASDVAVRLSALADLESAFLDPSGQLGRIAAMPSWRELSGGGLADYERRILDGGPGEDVTAALTELRDRLVSFDDLSQVDWPMDVRTLSTGALSEAINANALLFKKSAQADFLFGPNPRIGYRDYLVAVWVGIARTVDYWGNQLTVAQARRQLTNRFHQEFTTTDVRSVPVNEILIGIVRRILTEPIPSGYGLSAAAIPPRAAGQDARDYLDAMIGVSGESAEEFGLRYRLDLQRADAATSSPVRENIATLQGLFRDNFQSEPDPFHTAPDVHNEPMVRALGRAPFFLQYDEWLAQTGVFYPENNFSMLRSLRPDELVSRMQGMSSNDPLYGWVQRAIALFTDIQKAVRWISTGEYQLALNLLDETERGASKLIEERVAPWLVQPYLREPPMKARKRFKITDKASLLKFERYLGFLDSRENPNPYNSAGGSVDQVTAAMVLYAGYFYWVWRSDALLATGRFTEAVLALEGLIHVAVGAAEQDDPAGYLPGDRMLYTTGPLPYTYDRSTDVVRAGTPPYEPWLGWTGIFPLLHRVDVRFLQLRLGNVLLEWADALYRADDASLAARARELYKSVLWLHGEDPGISPTWPQNHEDEILLPIGLGSYTPRHRNPAVVSQISRARLGFTLLAAGLNYFGATDDMVPVQRYRVLEDQANQFAALAVGTERDFLAAMANLEQLSIDEMRTSNLLAKARAQHSIAREQQEIAGYNVAVAKQQVAEVQKQIDAKRSEIADHDSFFGQWEDFIGGASETVKSTLKGMEKTPFGDIGDQITSGIKAEMGFSGASSAGLLGLGTGASVLAGYALFVYVGYSTLSSMVDAQNTRAAELERLQTVTMPLAQGNVSAREHEVTITKLQATIAAADTELAQNLIAFNTQRLLNTEFWASVARVLQRVLRRYLDLGGWSAWLAERALAFEQDRSLNIVRMDYLVRSMQNVTGGELLQGDLAELEAARISGERALVPFTYAFSLVEEFPLAFGALKARGSCTFSTSEAALRSYFPGTFGHRIRTLNTAVRTATAGARVRGTLANHGVSLASTDEKLRTRALLRFPDAIAVSETRPGAPPDPRLVEVLGPFEGSGLDTTWTLQLDRAASAGWWDAIADIVIEVNGLARYSEGLRIAPAPPTPAHRFVMISARTFAAEDLAAVKNDGEGTVVFDLRGFPFAPGEENRTVANVSVLLPGATGAAVSAHLHLTGPPPVHVDFTIADSLALSNGEPLRLPGSVTPAADLNSAIGAAADQRWSIELESSPGADLSGLVDIIIGIDYTADPV
jgi:hypothetical protein